MGVVVAGMVRVEPTTLLGNEREITTGRERGFSPGW
jgi:hypothetical protein